MKECETGSVSVFINVCVVFLSLILSSYILSWSLQAADPRTFWLCVCVLSPQPCQTWGLHHHVTTSPRLLLQPLPALRWLHLSPRPYYRHGALHRQPPPCPRTLCPPSPDTDLALTTRASMVLPTLSWPGVTAAPCSLTWGWGTAPAGRALWGWGWVPGRPPGSCSYAGSNGSRPYRSMENLNWNNMADSGLCAFSAAPYRSMDSEFILRYTSTSHWYDGPPDGSVMGAHGLLPHPESLAFNPRHGLPRKDLPLFPQLLFPGGVDEWDVRKGLREKLRLQSARSAVESLKPLPLRPQMTPSATSIEKEGGHHVNSTVAGSRPLCTMRITSPEEIKQEVFRRLQLRRQNSSPNLTLHSSPATPKVVKTSCTTDNIVGNRNGSDSASECRRPPVGRLHIPTFEEFKRMRQREGEQSKESTAGSVVSGEPAADLQDVAAQSGSPRDPEEVEGDKSTGERMGSSDEDLQTITSSENLSSDTVNSNGTADPTSSLAFVTSTYSPICTGPSPRSPLPPLASSAQEKALTAGGEDGSSRRRRSSLEPAGSVPFPHGRENWGRPSSCCPALLLEGTDLSSYGAKIYKMKDGLIGSALDLIKKRLVWDGEREQWGELSVLLIQGSGSWRSRTGSPCCLFPTNVFPYILIILWLFSLNFIIAILRLSSQFRLYLCIVFVFLYY